MGIATFDGEDYGEEGEVEQDSDGEEYDNEQPGEKKAKPNSDSG
jgi:hypothetical protein